MQAIKKVQIVLIILTLIVFVAASPVTFFASEDPNFIPSIEIDFAMGVTVTLTDVHEHFVDFDNNSMGIWMSPTGTIAFNFAGEPSCPVLGRLYEGVPFSFQDIARRREISDLEWFYYVSFFLVQTPIQGELALSIDADYLVEAGLDDWVILRINGPSFDYFAEELQVRGRPLREREVIPQPLPLYDITLPEYDTGAIDTSFSAPPSTDETEPRVFSNIIIIAAISFVVIAAILGLIMLKRSKKKIM